MKIQRNDVEQISDLYVGLLDNQEQITVIVSFNIASEASYVYILSGQKLIENAKNGPFWRVFENNLRSNRVTRQVSFNRTKIGGKFKWDILNDFQTMCSQEILLSFLP